MVALRKELDLIWVWFYKEVAPMALFKCVNPAEQLFYVFIFRQFFQPLQVFEEEKPVDGCKDEIITQRVNQIADNRE